MDWWSYADNYAYVKQNINKVHAFGSLNSEFPPYDSVIHSFIHLFIYSFICFFIYSLT